MSQNRFLTRDYAAARDAVTRTFTEGVRSLAHLLDDWQRSLQGRSDKKLVNFSSHADHFQWLLEKNFAAEGFRNPEQAGQISSIAYLDNQHEKFEELFKAQSKQVMLHKAHVTDAQLKHTGDMIRLYNDCMSDYNLFAQNTGYETSLERVGEQDKRDAGAATLRSDRAVQITRDDLAFLIGNKIIAPLPKP